MPPDISANEDQLFALIDSVSGLFEFLGERQPNKIENARASLPDTFYQQISGRNNGGESRIFSTKIDDESSAYDVLKSISTDIIIRGYKVAIPSCEKIGSGSFVYLKMSEIPAGCVLVINAAWNPGARCNTLTMQKLFNDLWIRESKGETFGFAVVGIVKSEWNVRSNEEVRPEPSQVQRNSLLSGITFGLLAALFIFQETLYILYSGLLFQRGLPYYLTVVLEPLNFLRTQWISYFSSIFIAVMAVSMVLIYFSIAGPSKLNKRLLIGSFTFLLSVIIWPIYVLAAGFMSHASVFFGPGSSVNPPAILLSAGTPVYVITILQFYLMAASLLLLSYSFCSERVYTFLSIFIAAWTAFSALTDITSIPRFPISASLLQFNRAFFYLSVATALCIAVILIYMIAVPLDRSGITRGKSAAETLR